AVAGFHSIKHSMFDLAFNYRQRGMAAYSELQQREFSVEGQGYRAAKHQSFVGTGYFDQIAQTIAGGEVSTAALKGSTEKEQFECTLPAKEPSRALAQWTGD